MHVAKSEAHLKLIRRGSQRVKLRVLKTGYVLGDFSEICSETPTRKTNKKYERSETSVQMNIQS